jgi:glycosyltransferase involved in cell wall biosynthesis
VSAAALRVALLGPCTWPEVRRGAERMFRDLAGGLLARGHEPRLITSHPGMPGTTIEDGLPVTRTWRPPDARLLRRGWEQHLTHVPASFVALHRGAPDLAHASHAPDALAAVRWARRRGRVAIFSFMGIPDREWLVARRFRLECMLGATRCDAVVALSRTAADELARSLGVHARVINPGVDTRAFTPGGECSPVPRIVCTAPLDVAEKRVGLLLDAFPRVRRAHPQATLVLQRPADAALAASVAAEPGVELMDPDPGLLRDAYRRAWISALPSRSDAFGLVVAESMACGTPVVGSDRGALHELIDRPEVGRLFGGEDPAGIARALLEALELARDPACAAACRARAEEVSIDRCVDAYESLYRELLAAEGSSSGASDHNSLMDGP